MKNRTFNTFMPAVNELWAAEILNMFRNPQKGPDLIDNEKVLEIKFNLIYPNKDYNYVSWRTLEHQLAYNNGKPAFWGFGVYCLDRQVSEVKTTDIRELERMAPWRELFIVEWDWVKQFKCYRQAGKTEKSEWVNYIRFPKFSALPKTMRTYRVKKGLVHFTEDVPEQQFDIRTS